MVDYKALIKKMIDELKSSREEKVYSDEPILRTASVMQQELPEIYREMRAASKAPEAMIHSEAWLFCRQGEIIAEATDDFVYTGVFERFFPTYQLMSDNQLRGYVGWRTKYRNGEVTKTSLSYIYVYIYELLNLIGVKDAEDAFDRLKSLLKDYKRMFPQISRYLDVWMCDFAAYYCLDPEKYRSSFGADTEIDMLVLKNYREHSEDELFSAICALSSYNLENSRFCRDNMDDVKAVVCRVYAKYSEHYDKKRKISLFESLFGVKIANPYYRMFSSAVFHDKNKYKNYNYELSELNKYICVGGSWRREYYPVSSTRNKGIGKLLKAVDTVMREKYDFKHLLQYDDFTKLLRGIIEKEVDLYLKEKKKNQRPKIEIDLSKLSGIRAASEVTRDKLIVDEEPESEEVKAVKTESTPATKAENEAGLDEAEYKFLHCLLYGGDYKALLAEKKLMLSVVVDSINEKLYEILADTAIELEGDAPRLIDDYTEDLKGIVK